MFIVYEVYTNIMQIFAHPKSLNMLYHLAAIRGITIMAPAYVQSLKELQWPDLKVGLQDDNYSNGCQGDMSSHYQRLFSDLKGSIQLWSE